MSTEDLIVSVFNYENFNENTIIANYTKYSNLLIESKFLKMGELMHLAVADSVPKDTQICHAEKLLSPNLDKQEKVKAYKEFSDSFQARGIEFTALLDSIGKKFDPQCAECMVFALYCRILDVFKIVDEQNKKYITYSRIIVIKMLEKNAYKNELVLKILEMDADETFKRLSRMSLCILTYKNIMKVASGNSMCETQPTTQATVDSTSAVQLNTNVNYSMT